MSRNLLEYYGKRAPEYDRIYQRPERAEDLARLEALLQQSLAGEHVLELACGTGYWTARIAGVARSVCATDATPEPLSWARQRTCPPGRVRFQLADAYSPEDIPGYFTAGFAAFWWSHVPRGDLPRFLGALHRRLGAGARVAFCDNRYVEGSSTPIARVDPAGNSYQLRRLECGERYEVLKNFPGPDELERVIESTGGTDLSLIELTYYWVVNYRIDGVLP